MNITIKPLKIACFFSSKDISGWVSALMIWRAYQHVAQMRFIPQDVCIRKQKLKFEPSEIVFIVGGDYSACEIDQLMFKHRGFYQNNTVVLIEKDVSQVKELLNYPSFALKISDISIWGDLFITEQYPLIVFGNNREPLVTTYDTLVQRFISKYSLMISNFEVSFEKDDVNLTSLGRKEPDLSYSEQAVQNNAYLKAYFQDWLNSNIGRFKAMENHVEQSHCEMRDLVNSWDVTTLEDKLIHGKILIRQQDNEYRALAKTAVEVRLAVSGYDNIKIGFIPGFHPDFNVRKLSKVALASGIWDVIVVIADQVSDVCTLSLLTDSDISNVNIIDIGNQIINGPYGVTMNEFSSILGCFIKKEDLYSVILPKYNITQLKTSFSITCMIQQLRAFSNT